MTVLRTITASLQNRVVSAKCLRRSLFPCPAALQTIRWLSGHHSSISPVFQIKAVRFELKILAWFVTKTWFCRLHFLR